MPDFSEDHVKGYWGEFVAKWLLRFKGYEILGQRYRTVCGEIDIIAKRRDIITFVEVKTRKNEEKCFIAITPKQLQRIQRASMIFMQRNPKFQKCDIKYDVILVANWKFPLHIENVTA